jgi:site-specific DNA-cytosine methylase
LFTLELFPCSGGMAEGLRRAGIAVDQAFDYDADAVASYTHNLGHAPVRMDVRDLLRMVESGWTPTARIDLFVADPPCTPWSRAGKRKGEEDERDLIGETVSLVKLLKPTAFLIANVPGLDDGPNWHVVQRTIGSLSGEGYCIDFQRLDACNYGVPQHRVRPFWFGHPMGAPHIQWPSPSHADPKTLRTMAIPGSGELAPWVTCRQALGHLTGEDLGQPVRLRWRGANGKQVASVPDAPARVVGTSNLSDGNVLAHPTEAVRPGKRAHRHPGKKPRASHIDEPADVLTTRSNGGGDILFDGPDHRPSHADAPARTLTRNTHGDGALLVSGKHPACDLDQPASTIRGGGEGHSAPQILVEVPHHPVSELDEPARSITGSDGTKGNRILRTVLAHDKHPVNAPSSTLTRKAGMRGGQGPGVLRVEHAPGSWPWDRPSTTIQRDDRIPPPGHNEAFSTRSLPNAIKLSEKAAAILQGFPSGWLFSGDTKKARWAQIGMAMPPPLAEAVGRCIRAWFDKREAKGREAVAVLNGRAAT